MNKFLFALSILTIISLACGATAPSAKTVDDYVNEHGGNRDVYAKILALSDCSLLQTEFDIAAENNSSATPGTANHKETLGYMTAADDRMQALNCYSESNLAPTMDLSIIVAETAAMALTQTAMLIIPTVAITSTNLPTLTQPVIPTPITIPTSESTVIPSPTYIFILPTQQSGGTCACTSDTLNCPDFPDDPSAQRCMDYCISVGAGDIHNLDGDANGLACDGTP